MKELKKMEFEYEAPYVEVIEVSVEKGFASSYDLETSDEEWDGSYSNL